MMLSRIKTYLLLAAVALLFGGIALSQMPAEKTEAVITGSSYESFSYSTVTGLGTWQFRITINDTFSQHFQFTTIGPAGSIVTAVAAPATCTGLPRAVPVDCDITFPPGGTTLLITVTSPFAQQCAARIVAIGPITVNQSSINNPAGFVSNFGDDNESLVGGVRVSNVVPANTLLCATPTPNPATPTPTPSPTVTPVIPLPVVIPQVVQNPARGGIFNGSRNDTPTPVRPREVGTAGSTGVGLPPAGVMPALRPPSTGDAGLPTLRMLRLNAW